MNVTEAEKTEHPKIKHSIAITDLPKPPGKTPVPKQPTTRMKIINGRPYYYEVWDEWNAKEQRCRQKSKYLSKELPKG